MKKLATGDIKRQYFKKNKTTYFRIINNPLSDTIEYRDNPRENKEITRIFFTRYFANPQLYSMRNMAPSRI